MSQFVLGTHKTLKAEADYSAKQYLVVKFGATAGGCLLATADTDLLVGVIQNKPALTFIDGETTINADITLRT